MSYRGDVLTDFINTGWSLIDTFGDGHKITQVYLLSKTDGELAVLKVAQNILELHEIKENVDAARSITIMGIGYFHPWVRTFHVERGRGYVLLDYAGQSFSRVLHQEVGNINLVYASLLVRLLRVYRDSAMNNSEMAIEQLAYVVAKCITQLEESLAKMEGSGLLVTQLRAAGEWLKSQRFPVVTFSQWDFTPEDTYRDGGGTWRVSDLRMPVYGLPMIDLATFSGTCLAHGLPGSEWAYDRFKRLAQNQVAEICRIDSELALKVFNLGRILQLLLSARFRQHSNPTQAMNLYREAAKLISQIGDNR